MLCQKSEEFKRYSGHGRQIFWRVMGRSCEITRLKNSAGSKTPHFFDSILPNICLVSSAVSSVGVGVRVRLG